MEERDVPFRIAGSAAFFRRPEVRDAIAWLRVLADPDRLGRRGPGADQAAGRAPLGRPGPLTTIARRRKLDMVSASRRRWRARSSRPSRARADAAFLKLYGAAAGAMEERRADVFVRRLIERVGLRRQRLFAAQPGGRGAAASTSRAWPSSPPAGPAARPTARPGTSSATSRGRRGRGRAGRRRRAAARRRRAARRAGAVKGMEFDRVFVLGLGRGARAGGRSEPSGSPRTCSRAIGLPSRTWPMRCGPGARTWR